MPAPEFKIDTTRYDPYENSTFASCGTEIMSPAPAKAAA